MPRQRLWKIRARQVVLASGALERPLVFADNDRPGIMLAHAAATYATRYAALAGRRAIVFTNNDSAYRAALDLIDAGCSVAAAIDLRHTADGPLPQKLREHGVEIMTGHGIVATEGHRRLAAASVAPIDGNLVRAAAQRRFECDLMLMSGGWNPAVHLFSQSRGSLRYDEAIAAFVPDKAAQPVCAAGSANGSFSLAACLAEGFRAGGQAAADAGIDRVVAGPGPRAASEPADAPLKPVWQVPTGTERGKSGKRFVDFQNDVTAEDIALAHREGYRSIEHVKRYTTTGMGTDQGKTGNVNALAILAEAQEKTPPEIGTTTFRPPYTPVTIGAFAGYERDVLLDPVRRTPIHAWHEAHGAVFENVGQWRRAHYYPRAGETMDEAVQREAKAARTTVGIFDASTLGKIEIAGPDAAEFLDRIYTNKFSTLKPGRIRYGVMLGENGLVIDDGISARLAGDRFLMSTTSGHAATVLNWLEEWLQCEWTSIRVHCVGVTEQWATVSLTGPESRKLLSELTDEIALDAASFPFMSWRTGRVAGIPARIMRVSFTGDLSYEVNVPASWGQALWQACMAAGEKYGIVPYGTEAIHVLRAEKGYFIVGRETDGTTTATDLGAGWMVDMSKPDFIGRRSLLRSDTARDDRRQLVGLATENPSEVIPEGAQIVGELQARPPMPMIGYVSSSYFSPNCGRSIALAMIDDGRRRLGDTVALPLEDRTIRAKIVSPVFFDPEGERLRG
jgi:sarcosine oxidase subunit alpha